MHVPSLLYKCIMLVLCSANARVPWRLCMAKYATNGTPVYFDLGRESGRVPATIQCELVEYALKCAAASYSRPYPTRMQITWRHENLKRAISVTSTEHGHTCIHGLN